MAGAQGGHRSPAGKATGFPGSSLGAQEHLVSRRVPTPSPDPCGIPASRNKRPSASLGLGPLGPGREKLA